MTPDTLLNTAIFAVGLATVITVSIKFVPARWLYSRAELARMTRGEEELDRQLRRRPFLGIFLATLSAITLALPGLVMILFAVLSVHAGTTALIGLTMLVGGLWLVNTLLKVFPPQ